MTLFHRITIALRDYFDPAVAAQHKPKPLGPQPPDNRTPEERIADAAINNLEVPHACYEEITFRSVDEFGAVLTSSEEWIRHGSSLRTVIRRAKVITTDNAIVTKDQIGGICVICKGFIAAPILRCAACGGAVCASHHKKFGNAVLCHPHYERALNEVNTWATEPRDKEKS